MLEKKNIPDQKIALITGANKGIGFETSRQLGEMGCKVLICARNEKLGKITVETLKKESIDAQLLVVDVTSQKTINMAVKFI